ncbi:50S ribosomal protein L10 [Candidatus Daviesbacteria bacterium]|nr:50S ribosomal protein L10 [Candidatus Daviesbacteria bacterium]
MPKTRIQKEDTVVNLTDKLSKAKSVVFADYRGMTMKQLSDLRSKLREQNSQFSITKNNLLNLALKNAKLDLDQDGLTGPTATLFNFEDEISPIKLLTKALKDNQIGSIKSGILNGEILSNIQILKLASLPSKEELRAKVVGGISGPLYGIVGVLQANLRNLSYVLDQIKIQKGGV